MILLCACLAPAALAGGGHRGVEHVVIVWLKNPGDHEARQRVLNESRKLSAIPGVLSISAGGVIPSPRPVVDSSFDVALIVRFVDIPAMENYLTHPLHLQLLENTLKPLVARIQVYDFAPMDPTPEEVPPTADGAPQATPD